MRTTFERYHRNAILRRDSRKIGRFACFPTGRYYAGMVAHIEIVPYDPAWPGAFASERERIAKALGSLALRIEHNGSTSVPELAAKPIIDIQVSVAALQPLAPYVSRLHTLGYTHVPHADDTFCAFLHKPAQHPHSHHIHLVVAGGDEERRTLAFRDYLRDHDDARDAYARLKKNLAPQFDANDGDRYAIAKTHFIESIIADALAHGYPRNCT